MKNFEAKKFGAFVAHILNTPADGSPDVRVHEQRVDGETCSFESFIKWFLANNKKYLLHLVGILELGLALPSGTGFRPSLSRSSNSDHSFDDADRAVDLWYEHVFDRPLMLTKSEPMHNGHRLLERLLKRCTTDRDVRLERRKRPPLAAAPQSVSMVRLRDQMERAGAPQPTANAVKSGGPLYVLAGKERQEVPDGLSLGAAIYCAPEEMRHLDVEDELELIGFLQEAMNTANRHWLFLRRLGLSPPDFMASEEWETQPFDTLTTNQAQTATKWMKLAKSLAHEDGLPEPGRRHYAAAWDQVPISKKIRFEDFAVTIVGRALMSTEVVRTVSFDRLSEQGFEVADAPAEIGSYEETQACLQELSGTGAVDDVTLLILHGLANGMDLEQIHSAHAEVRLRFRRVDDLYNHSDELAEQIQGIASALQD